ncbi:serine palmitoyltransferase small subunit B isoform X1 [Hyaena hyaena]|uniref:serine palmitoyltransferase small subunit B isoform X1 n=1 Tax=Hyaena hyaena TaxID=95912 RepID=UPI001923E976|nr:serine palmitoyltransferase small subunit B isoform X1 [Hyaena hyaena]XP_039097910.1 serine palmitoyltransferase small subunit B isoform X1 [Hyaena hyaena]
MPSPVPRLLGKRIESGARAPGAPAPDPREPAPRASAAAGLLPAPWSPVCLPAAVRAHSPSLHLCSGTPALPTRLTSQPAAEFRAAVVRGARRASPLAQVCGGKDAGQAAPGRLNAGLAEAAKPPPRASCLSARPLPPLPKDMPLW